MSATWLRRLFGESTNDEAAQNMIQLASNGQRPTPVTRARIEQYLAQHDYSFELDSDGDVTGLWDGNQLWFLLLGEDTEVLQVRGRWQKALAGEDRATALRAINDWNRDRIWPKVYLRQEEPGLALYAEVSVDLEHGVTDAQLSQYLECGIATSGMALNSIPPTLSPLDG